MKKPFTKPAKEVMVAATEASVRLNHTYIGTEHLLLGLADVDGSTASRILGNHGVTPESLEKLMEKSFISEGGIAVSEGTNFTPRAEHVIEAAGEKAEAYKAEAVGTEHLLLALIKEQDCAALHLLHGMSVDRQKLLAEVLVAMGENINDHREELQKGKQAAPKPGILKNFTRNLNQEAKDGKLDPIIGREDEVARVVQILSRRTKNNPCLVGEPGVGKTSIAEALAQRIEAGLIQGPVASKQILSLDLPAMVAGSKYRGDFEDRVKKVINEVREDGHVILFMDEIHTMIGAGGAEGSIDAANILKPALAKGEIQIIGATTLDEYRKHFEKDAALERRFQPVPVEQPDRIQTLRILKGLRPYYEEHHNVKITDEALKAAVELSARYINDRFLPDKAIDLIDESASKVRLSSYIAPEEAANMEKQLQKLFDKREKSIKQGNMNKASELSVEIGLQKDRIRECTDRLKSDSKSFLSVTSNDVAEVVSKWTKIPVQKLAEEENTKLMNLENTLHKRVIAQNEAIVALSKAIRRGRVGLKDPDKPIGTFLFLGPTGVGKTELSKALAEAMFGSENSIIRVDMSEYMEKHSVSKLIGSPPGYVGYDEGGQLSEQVRRNPYSIILFDEVEKAHPDVFNILLQVLDDGRITDAHGRVTDFKNTIIIMTSNAGAQRIMEPKNLGFASEQNAEVNYKKMKESVLEEIKQIFKPEFLNRIDEIIVFESLTRENMQDIIDILLKGIITRAKSGMNIRLKVSKKAKVYLVEQGYDPKYGARALKRKVQTLLEDELAEQILEGNVKPNTEITIDMDNNKLIFKTVKELSPGRRNNG